jgi:hypothetical protein
MKITKDTLKQLVREELATNEGLRPVDVRKKECVKMFCDSESSEGQWGEKPLGNCGMRASGLYDKVCANVRDAGEYCFDLTPEEIVEKMLELDYDNSQEPSTMRVFKESNNQGYQNMKITKQRLKDIIREELELHEGDKSQSKALSNALLKDLIKEEMGLAEEEPFREVAEKFNSLLKEWKYEVKPRLEGNLSQACGYAIRHRRKALDLTTLARKLGAKELAKKIRTHRYEVVRPAMTVAGC